MDERTDAETEVIEAYRLDLDLQRLQMDNYTYGTFAKLRSLLEEMASRVAEGVKVKSPGEYAPNYLRGLNAGEADLEVIAINEGCRPGRAVSIAEKYLQAQIDNGRIAAVFGRYPESQKGFIDGYRAALAAATTINYRHTTL